MEERMNKEELLKLISTLDLDINDFTILSSSALMLRGVLEDAGDLDIAVSPKGLELLKSKFNLTQKPNGWYIVSDKIECVLDPMEGNKELIGNYYLHNIFDYLRRLEESERPKDKAKIPQVKTYIKNNYRNGKYIGE